MGGDKTAPTDRAEPIPDQRGLHPELPEIQEIAKNQVVSWREIAAALSAAAKQALATPAALPQPTGQTAATDLLHRLDAAFNATFGLDAERWSGVFATLGADVRTVVLQACIASGAIEGQCPGEDAAQRKLDRYDQAIALGTASLPGAATPSDFAPWQAGFDRLGQDAQEQVLIALFNAASAEGRRPGENAAQRSLARYNQVIALATASLPGAATPSEIGRAHV